MYNNNIKNLKELQVLKDTNKQGNSIDWREKKLNTTLLAESYERLENKKSERVLECGTFLEFNLLKDSTLKLTRANFCKVRLCPMCSWRRSLKIFGQASRVLDLAEEKHNLRFIFLTLTLKNCYSDDLDQTIKDMNNAFNKMTRLKRFKTSIKGYFKALEITYNKIDDTYHPHFHIILGVSPSYFTHGYISQKEWTEIWKNSLGIEYNPIVDVRAVRKNNKKEVSEVAKYTVKTDDFLIKENGEINEKMTDKVVKTLDKVLSYKRLVSFGFLFKDIHKALNLDDAENGDLVNTDNDEIREDLTNIILRYQWNIGLKNYTLKEVVPN